MSTTIPIQVHTEIFLLYFWQFWETSLDRGRQTSRLLGGALALRCGRPSHLGDGLSLLSFYVSSSNLSDLACHSDGTRATLSLSALVYACLTYF